RCRRCRRALGTGAVHARRPPRAHAARRRLQPRPRRLARRPRSAAIRPRVATLRASRKVAEPTATLPAPAARWTAPPPSVGARPLALPPAFSDNSTVATSHRQEELT